MDEELKEVLRKILKDEALIQYSEREALIFCALCDNSRPYWDDADNITHREDCGIHIIRKHVEG